MTLVTGRLNSPGETLLNQSIPGLLAVARQSGSQPASSRLFAFMSGRAAGFTLLELMVVLVIIGIVMTFVTVSVGGDNRAKELDREARRLAALMDLASDEAILRSSQLAVRFGDAEYEFYSLQGNAWLPLTDDSQLRLRTLPEGVTLDLELEDSPPLGLNADPDQQQPQVFILSSGEMTPFILTLSAPETRQRYQVKGGLTGEVALQ